MDLLGKGAGGLWAGIGTLPFGGDIHAAYTRKGPPEPRSDKKV